MTSQDDERPPSPGWSMAKRFMIAAVAIVALSAGATATVALNKITGIAEEVFPKLNEINAPKGVVTAEYSGGPQTFLILGTDRRVGAKDSYDRENPPHSDTILLVRFDPGQGQTSVLSIPRDLMVNITTKNGESYPKEKINAAYTIGNKLGATKGGMVLAAETIEHEVFPGLKLNGIVDVSFQGLHQSRGHARLRVCERRSPLLQRERGVHGNGLHIDQPAARLSEAVLRKRARLRALPPHRLGLRAGRPPARLSARPARADLSEQRDRSDRHGRQGRRARDQLDVPRLRERADRTVEADRVLADQAVAPGQVPDRQRQLPGRERRLLRDLDPRTGAGDTGAVPARSRTGERARADGAHAHLPPHEPRRLARVPAARAGPVPDLLGGRRRSGQAAVERAVPGAVSRRCRPARPNSSRCARTRSRTSRATSTTPTWWCGTRTRSAATTTSRARTG